MTAAAADRMTQTKDLANKAYPVKGTTKIYAGTMVGINADGFAVPAADAAALAVAGKAKALADNTGADGAINVVVERGVFLFAATSITQAMVGEVMYVVDDQTFDDTKGTNGVKAGRLVEYVGAASGWIEIGGAMGVGAVTTAALATAVADANATYGQEEADLINDLKAKYNAAVTLVNELQTVVNKYLA
jgi:hypothetical protein